MTGESGKAVIRCFVKDAPDQLLARAATMLDPDARPAPLDGRLRERYLAENQRPGEQACGSWPPRAGTSTRPPSIPGPGCSRS